MTNLKIKKKNFLQLILSTMHRKISCPKRGIRIPIFHFAFDKKKKSDDLNHLSTRTLRNNH